VRYRYDKTKNKRQTTIELIVDEQDWTQGHNIRPDQVVPIKIGFGEMDLRDTVKQSGAYRDKNRKVWLLSLKQVYSLSLEKRIIDGLEFQDMQFLINISIYLMHTYINYKSITINNWHIQLCHLLVVMPMKSYESY